MDRPGVSAEIRVAETADELRRIQRFKYDVYVTEMGRYGSIADHERRLLVEPDDAASVNVLATVDGAPAATMRLSFGGDGALTERHVAQYDLGKFLAEVPIEALMVGERLMLAPEFRGTDLLGQMFAFNLAEVSGRRIQFVFGDCEPHLLNTYQPLGFRTYTARNVNSPETGYLIPLVLVTEDMEHLRRLASPFARMLTDFGETARVPDTLEALLSDGDAVLSERLSDPEAFRAEVLATARAAGALQAGIFEGLDEDEIALVLRKSVVLACRPGDRVIKRGNSATNMSICLSGALEVRRAEGEPAIATIAPGEVFGEIAFFLREPRTMDVLATAPDTRVAALNNRTLLTLAAEDGPLAARVMGNIAAMLARRLEATSRRLH